VGVAPAPIFLWEDPEGPEDQLREQPFLPYPDGDATADEYAESRSVLVVEDDPAMQMLCEFNLRRSGFGVTTAST
jgi:hypothetical protein